MFGKSKGESFTDYLDAIMVISKEVIKEQGEDSFFCASSSSSAIVSVCDGCGGLGARKYDAFNGHTGAFMAARIVSGALQGWYSREHRRKWKDSAELASSVKDSISEAFEITEPYSRENRKILGTMVRKMPTTLAMAYAEAEGKEIIVHLVWAGDSRVYLLDSRGLAQLTKDDLFIEDAYENLTKDGALTNVISSDGNYILNHKTIRINKPAMIIAATDGCFSYIPSPMEFEYEIVNALSDADDPEQFRKKLKSSLSQYAGDDMAMGLMSFHYGDFRNTRKAFSEREHILEQKYIEPLKRDNRLENTANLWIDYKPEYEKYL